MWKEKGKTLQVESLDGEESGGNQTAPIINASLARLVCRSEVNAIYEDDNETDRGEEGGGEEEGREEEKERRDLFYHFKHTDLHRLHVQNFSHSSL